MQKDTLPGAALSLGVFGIISTEIGIVGVLPELAARAGVSVAQAGLLVGVFALVVAVTGPFGVLVASRFSRKSVLLVTMAVFTLANVVFAVSASFPVLVIFRILPALLHPIFFAVSLATAVALAAPGRETAATARVFAGVTVGFAFGVPAMSFLASEASLGVAFGAAALVSASAFFGILRWVPRSPAEERLSYGSQLRILRRPQVWVQLVTIVLLFAAMFSGYSFFADYLGAVAGVPAATVSVLLLVFGVVMIGGNFLFAALIQRSLRATLLGFLLAYIALYAALYAAAPSAWLVSLLVLPWGLVHSGGLILGQTLIARESADAPVFGNSLFVSASNIGIALGSALGAAQIAQAGTLSVVWVGVGAALTALVLVGLNSAMLTVAGRRPATR